MTGDEAFLCNTQGAFPVVVSVDKLFVPGIFKERNNSDVDLLSDCNKGKTIVCEMYLPELIPGLNGGAVEGLTSQMEMEGLCTQKQYRSRKTG